MRKLSEEKKKNIMRVIVLIMAVAMLLGIVILPLTTDVSAEETGVKVTVSSFETGNLSAAIEEAKDGADLNTITGIAVSGGILDSSDYSAICGYPNIEFLELAGCETENGVIPENAMQSRNQLSYVSLPSNTETIGARAFAGNRKLLKISIPSTLRVIGEYAFQGCEGVERIDIPAEVTSIGAGAFADCKALKEFALPEALTEVPDYCFSKCSITEMHFGPQIERIGEGAFSDCHSLTDIYFYGDKAPAASQSSFQNAKVTIHTYDGGEGFDSLENNFVSVGYDLSEDSKYTPPQPSETQAAETVKETEAAEETEAVQEESEEKADETEAVTSEEKKEEESEKAEADTENESKSEAQSETAETEAVPAASSSNGSFSGIAVLIIGVLCAALAVTVTLLVVGRKK